MPKGRTSRACTLDEMTAETNIQESESTAFGGQEKSTCSKLSTQVHLFPNWQLKTKSLLLLRPELKIGCRKVHPVDTLSQSCAHSSRSKRENWLQFCKMASRQWCWRVKLLSAKKAQGCKYPGKNQRQGARAGLDLNRSGRRHAISASEPVRSWQPIERRRRLEKWQLAEMMLVRKTVQLLRHGPLIHFLAISRADPMAISRKSVAVE